MQFFSDLASWWQCGCREEATTEDSAMMGRGDFHITQTNPGSGNYFKGRDLVIHHSSSVHR